MKIIFLDIDGVLNSWHEFVNPGDRIYTSKELWSTEDIFPKYIKRLNKIIADTGAKIVISSSWRKLHTLDNIKKMFNTQGFKGEILDKTPVLHRTLDGTILDRGDEIKKWLEETSIKIDTFIILDDFRYENFACFFKQQFVFIPDSEGIQEDHVQQAINKLGT